MVVNHEMLVRKLKKQVKLLQRREEIARSEIRSALKKASKLGKVYKSRLVKKVHVMKGKMASAEAVAFVKAAADLERRLLKNIETKTKAFATALVKIEKAHATHLAKCLSRKARTTRKRIKKTRK